MLRLSVRLALLVIIILLFTAPFYLTWRLKAYRVNGAFVKAGFYLGRIVLGVRVKTEGVISDRGPLLIVSNHFSYLDVFVLGSLMNLRFTPKSDVASWPVIGFFCKINGCIFIDRRPSQTAHNKKALEKAIEEKTIISLFPEGTTNDGTQLQPFKSSFFSIAENNNLTVQPVSIVYTKLNGKSITAQNRHIIGWYGDAEFFPHLKELAQESSVDVTVIFHKPVNGKDFTSRKELALYCHDVIGSALKPY